jgi:2-polyprenyl-3-methyl-5-hydroxy-6-metoxy-1,4-benzoquinol methylase
MTAETPHRARRKLRLIDDSDEAWREFGLNDPYFGVLTDDKFRKENLTADSLKEFFDSGETHVAAILATLHNHVTSSLQMDEAMDFGCGVGRLVLPLAARFGKVTGVDISEAYRSAAQDNCTRRGIANVQFLETLTPLLETGAHFDLVHSSIVFNHIPWHRGKVLIRQIFGLLRPRGAMAIQVMLSRRSTAFRRAGSWLRRNFLPFNWLINIAHGRRVFEPLMQGHEYPLEELLPLLKAGGGGDFHIRIEMSPQGQLFAFIFCVKDQ